ncbi:hypothetical protein JDV02_005334 [Purpureocillium takamizusanense]|uniref:Uncharacterized protein n=1 Tax=Purpureocillium takamizusanense TaxID=2060973 RepID=A0A9Q8QFS6_9HYPO|nr:uncharacterized protein JDV02_005334 [Purpureocillium takamizusanense]UNI19118.1 hypothetical protein JDV02_005334 [Purpureocillium takamizusanense]
MTRVAKPQMTTAKVPMHGRVLLEMMSCARPSSASGVRCSLAVSPALVTSPRRYAAPFGLRTTVCPEGANVETYLLCTKGERIGATTAGYKGHHKAQTRGRSPEEKQVTAEISAAVIKVTRAKQPDHQPCRLCYLVIRRNSAERHSVRNAGRDAAGGRTGTANAVDASPGAPFSFPRLGVPVAYPSIAWSPQERLGKKEARPTPPRGGYLGGRRRRRQQHIDFLLLLGG